MSPKTSDSVKQSSVEWIESGGGPLLLLSEELLPDWEGIQVPSNGRIVQARFRFGWEDAPATDYDRAADVEDYVGCLPVGNGQGLVLGGEPMATCWLSDATGLTGMLVRWQHGEDESYTLSLLADLPSDVWVQAPCEFCVGERSLKLFDAAYPGNQIDRYLTVRLAKGRYSISTWNFTPDESTSLILHRFLLTQVPTQHP